TLRTRVLDHHQPGVLGVADVTIGGPRGEIVDAVAIEVAAGKRRSVAAGLLQRQVEVAGDVGLEDVPWQVRRRVAGGKAQRHDDTTADRLALHRLTSLVVFPCPASARRRPKSTSAAASPVAGARPRSRSVEAVG